MDSQNPNLVPCTFLIPLAYNDGQPVEQERREGIEDRLFVEFGGCTTEGEVKGTYRREDTGQKQVERLLKVRVAVPGQEGVDRLRRLIAQIGGELEQECMYLEVSVETVAELVP